MQHSAFQSFLNKIRSLPGQARAAFSSPAGPRKPLYASADHRQEHVLVCLSPAPANARVIESAAEIAKALHANFTALYVELSGSRQLTAADTARLTEHINLAEERGAKIATIYGSNVAVQIAEYARLSGITRIFLGYPDTRAAFSLPGRSLGDQLMRLLPDVELHLLPHDQPPYRVHSVRRPEPFTFSLTDCLKSLLVIGCATGLGYVFFRHNINDANIITLYLLGILIISVWTGDWIYSAVSLLASVIIFNYLFTEPRLSLRADSRYTFTFLVMLLAGLLTSSLTRRMKLQIRQAVSKAYRSEILLETSQLLQNAENESEIFSYTARQLFKLAERPIFFLSMKEGKMTPVLIYPPEEEEHLVQIMQEELDAAAWVCKNNKYAGWSTDHFGRCANIYLPVHGKYQVLAVAGFQAEGSPSLESFEKNMLLTLLDECGLALEKERLVREKQKAELAAQQESLRANLLRAISHDLRTPLTGIIGNADILMENEDLLDEEKKRSLYSNIYDDSIWLLNLVENLLSVTRLEDGTIRLKTEPELLDEIFREALSHLDRHCSTHRITISLADDMMMAVMDAHLIVQVIINIINNAIKYTPAGSHILMKGERTGDGMVKISIADDGPGIPKEAQPNLFTMFYTANNARSDGRRGLGLGLFLCRSIVNAHGGTLVLEDNEPSGCIFSFTLRGVEVNQNEQI